MSQICSNGRSEKVNKRLRRGNKRMRFLINLKEEQQGDLVNPSFICCLGPLVCLLHNVVLKKGGRKIGGCNEGITLYCVAPNEMSTDLTAPQNGARTAFSSVLSILLFIKLCAPHPPKSSSSSSSSSPTCFEASFAASWL